MLHTALRNRSGIPVLVNGRDVMPDVETELCKMRQFASAIRNGEVVSENGRKFADVVNIGIGGSDLGPAMATMALGPYHDGPRLHFVSNVDAAHISDTITPLNPETTFFLIASKTFTTVETMTNAKTARSWIANTLGEQSVPNHFAAISTAAEAVEKFGIEPDRMFGFWDWVGGRYSIWSAIGLPLMIAIGPANFDRFLNGGNSMDKHFCNAPLRENLPVLLGMLGIWHRNVCGFATRAVIPYDQRLSRFPAYLQQLDMESNGKGTTADGKTALAETGPIVWGEPGTNGQHAFFQLVHQGTTVIPVEFLIAANGHEPELAHHHNLLVANCLAQSEALMRGRDVMEARNILIGMGFPEADADRLAPHKAFPGNRPSSTIVYGKLDPHTLGQLIALYEHRVFVEGAIWNINSFDQWGVELGKELAGKLLPMVEGTSQQRNGNGSTIGLLNRISKFK